jgi:hypothetical protein
MGSMQSFEKWPLRILGVLSLSFLLVCGAIAMSPKEESEGVLNVGLPFAQKMLVEHREFYPFAFARLGDGKVVAVATVESQEHPKPQEIIEKLVTSLKAGVARGEYRASGVFMNARVKSPERGELVDAIQVNLEHIAGYCVDVYVPYSRDPAGKVTFGSVFASKRAGAVFTTCK